jgi:hypothetical protein
MIPAVIFHSVIVASQSIQLSIIGWAGVARRGKAYAYMNVSNKQK